MKRAFFVVTAVLAFFACRENMPDDGPQTPANSPMPKLDRPENEPAKPPAPTDVTTDGGK